MNRINRSWENKFRIKSLYSLTSKIVYIILLSSYFSYSQPQEVQWAVSAGGSGDETICHIVTCPNGEVIVSGEFRDNITFGSGQPYDTTLFCLDQTPDWFIALYDSSGMLLWAESIQSEGWQYQAKPNVDWAGNIYIIGYFAGELTFRAGRLDEKQLSSFSYETRIFIAKYHRDASLEWVQDAGGATSDDQCICNDIALDNAGNIYIAGYFRGPANFGGIEIPYDLGNNDDIFIAKYNSSGKAIWAQAAGCENNFDYGYGIAVDKEGNVGVTGIFCQTAIFGKGQSNQASITADDFQGAFVAKYDSAGIFLWVTGISTIYGGYDIAMDSDGNLIATGAFMNEAVFRSVSGRADTLKVIGWDDIFLVKYDPFGDIIWINQDGGIWGDFGEKVQVNDDDEILLEGVYMLNATFGKGQPNETILSIFTFLDSTNNFCAKYTADGQLIWAVDADSLGLTNNTCTTIDKGGYLVRSGEFYETIALGSGNNTYTLKSAGGSDIYLAKLSENPTAIIANELAPSNFGLFQNYPNPFNPQTVISYQLAVKNQVELSICNIMGQKVRALVSGQQTAGRHEVVWDGTDATGSPVASGIYFYRIKAGEFVQTKRMLLMR